jgi:hypothetical protein
MWAACGFCRQVPADAAASQFSKASASTFPLLPDDGAQPPPGPFIKRAQHRWGLAEAEVTAPSDQVDGQLFDDLHEASSARAPRQFPDSCFETGECLRRDAAPGGCCSPYVKLKPRNLRTLGLETALLALLTLSLRRLARNVSMLAITRSPAR